MFAEEGYESIWGLALEEYGLSKSTASRYMTMNDRFSQNGNSPAVQDKYKEFGKSQLQEMLYLTDEQLEEVSPKTQVKVIRELRREREIPYMDIPGQLTISDFPSFLPSSELILGQQVPNAGSTTFTLNDFAANSGTEKGDVAISQPEPTEIIDVEFAKVKQPATYDKSIMMELIAREERMLAELEESWKKKQPWIYTKHCMMLEAYRMLQEKYEGKNGNVCKTD